MCGGASDAPRGGSTPPGRSPRVRGSRRVVDHLPGAGGSIPACAGEPLKARLECALTWVDPRVCGGAAAGRTPLATSSGRSPRVRGSLPAGRLRSLPVGSIPACAGEPPRSRRSPRRPGVDPRVCGGALDRVARAHWPSGRSPRVRGSQAGRGARVRTDGSIPACAGEPAASSFPSIASRVDPRVCGGASGFRTRHGRWLGRSPRVRGSQTATACRSAHWGSIPACAGEPSRRGSRATAARVDPRVCGGAQRPRRSGAGGGGRSPRVRGSPRLRQRPRAAAGSIPACAGEPSARAARARWGRVDPRVCGGARFWRSARGLEEGRSPRVRGSLVARRDGRVVAGSIPACAGEPCRRRSRC